MQLDFLGNSFTSTSVSSVVDLMPSCSQRLKRTLSLPPFNTSLAHVSINLDIIQGESNQGGVSSPSARWEGDILPSGLRNKDVTE